jgi:hypothetical protein
MSRGQKVVLALIWFGIVGGIVAVLFSWQVRREWVDPGGYMLVRRNLLTSEVDVWIGGQWVPLQRAGSSRGPLLAESRPQQAQAPPGAAPAPSALPARAPSPGLVERPAQPPQQVAAPAPRRARAHAPVRVKAALPPPAEPPPETAVLSPQPAVPPAEAEGPPAAVSTNPDLPIVRAPSPDGSPEAEQPPPPPSDQVASAGEDAPASSAQGPA